MTQPLRRVHERVTWALAVLLPLLLIAGAMAQREQP